MSDEKEKKYREEFEVYAKSFIDNIDVNDIDEAFDYIVDYVGIGNVFIAGRKAGQEEIDRARNAVKNEGLIRDHYVNECVKLRAEIHRLKDLVKCAKPFMWEVGQKSFILNDTVIQQWLKDAEEIGGWANE